MLSVIIPSYKEPLLPETVDSLLQNAEGDMEILVVIDGNWLTTPVKTDSRVKVLYLENHLGMRAAINAGLALAKGDFIMKIDAHCMVGQGFDRIMSLECAGNWLLIPRRYSLDEVGWKRDESRPIRDYHYIGFPEKSKYYGHTLSIGNWSHMTHARRDPAYDIDDVMTLQGSCWFANRKYFMEHVGLLDDRTETYGSFAGDQQEIGLKYWLGGGENKVIKKTWYAHLSKRRHHYHTGLYDRLSKMDPRTVASHTWSARHWMNDEEPNMKHSLSWLLEKFWPVPAWPENWKEVWQSYKL